MALFLLKDRDATHPDPEKDRRGCYKRGDIVEVLDDGRHDGDLVANPIAAPFYLVRVTGLTREEAVQYMAARLETVACARCGGTGVYEGGFCSACNGAGVKQETHTRRLWSVPLDGLPLAIRTALQTTRYYEVAWATIRGYVRNKRTGAGA